MLLNSSPNNGLPRLTQCPSWIFLNMMVKLRIMSFAAQLAKVVGNVLNPGSP
jgi:hypothetical protein